MTKMTLPVSFNEPTSLLQRVAEDLEYTDLLDIGWVVADLLHKESIALVRTHVLESLTQKGVEGLCDTAARCPSTNQLHYFNELLRILNIPTSLTSLLVGPIQWTLDYC
jgi:hypothetical protein